MLSFKNISFHYKSGLEILRDFSLDLNPPLRIAIVGPSGIGKTTILNLVAGISQCQSGSIVLDGEVISTPGPSRVLVFQNHALLPWKNVRGNIELSLLHLGLSKSDVELKIADVLKLVKLTGFENYYPSQLSGGMKQRVGLARAIVLKPRLLLLDEPFAGLDALTRIELTSELSQIYRDDHIHSSILVTHNIEEALYLADQVLVFNERPLSIVGTFSGLRSHHSFLEVKQSEEFRKTELAIHKLLKS